MVAPASSRPRWPRRLLAVGLGVLLALVTLEVVMQLVAYAWWRNGQAARAPLAAGRDAVLCLGDSFTYGLGATDRSGAYPRVLADLLDAQPGGGQVVSRAWPGHESGRVLAELEGHLDALRPRLVYLLVGYNNRSGSAAPAVARGEPGVTRFPLRLRTLELLQRIAFSWSDAGAAVAKAASTRPLALLGRWHGDAFEVVFEADGRADFGGVACTWEADGGRLLLVPPDGEQRALDWRVTGTGLELRGGMLGSGAVQLVAGGLPPTPLARARSALAAGELERARALVAAAPPDRAWLGVAVELAAADADQAGLGEALARLRALAADDPAACAELVRSCLAVGESAEGLAEARRCLESDPRDSVVWSAVFEAAAVDGAHVAGVRRLLDWGIGRLEGDRAWHWQLLSTRACLLDRRSDDAVGALADALQSAAVHGSQTGVAADLLARDPERYNPAVVDAALARLDLDPDQRRVVQALIDAAAGRSVVAGPSLARDLRAIVQRCAASGAQLVLMTYPESTQVDDTLRSVAAATGTPLLDLQPPFAEALRGRPRGHLFVLDGHCNDRGYALIAAVVAADVRRRW